MNAFDFSGEWSIEYQDPNEKVAVVRADEGEWELVGLECPNCFEYALYKKGEFWWANSDETKRAEATERENELLSKALVDQRTRVAKLMQSMERLRRKNGELMNQRQILADAIHRMKKGEQPRRVRESPNIPKTNAYQ
jgi:hypothetical protein